jgi:hypothetical protein
MNLVKFKPKKILLFIGLMGWFSIPFFFPIVEYYGKNYYHYGLIYFYQKGSYLIFLCFAIIPIFFILNIFIMVFQIRSWTIKFLLICLGNVSYVYLLFSISNGGLILFGTYAFGFNIIIGNALLLYSMFSKRS